jgi:flagellar P-ring protein precursor FlgI
MRILLAILLLSALRAQDVPPAAAEAPLAAAPPPVATPAPLPAAPTIIEVPIRQITRLHGTMANTLNGVGLVVGLNGTGSSDKASRQLLANYIKRIDNVNIDDSDLTPGSWALVTVTAELPPFSKQGMQLPLAVSAISDASSLFGGRLLYTTLRAVDGKVYATAAGPVSISGVGVQQNGTKVSRNNPVAGRIADGAMVVEDLESFFLSEQGHLELGLINPSLGTAQAIAAAVTKELAAEQARGGVVDETLVRVELPRELRTEEHAIRLLGRIRDLKVRVENPATVVVDEAAGIVIAGEGVMISPCVVALADLTITVVSEDEVVQPLPGWNQGETAIVNRTRIDVTTQGTDFKPVAGGATVGELLGNLRALQLTPRQVMEVFEYLSAGGYLQARLQKKP